MIPAFENKRIPQERGGKVTRSCRKTLEIDGKWKQYSGRNFLDFFQCLSGRFLREWARKWPKFIRKNPETFRPEYYFHVSLDFRCFPTGIGPFFLI
jgi:hypothetical protein